MPTSILVNGWNTFVWFDASWLLQWYRETPGLSNRVMLNVVSPHRLATPVFPHNGKRPKHFILIITIMSSSLGQVKAKGVQSGSLGSRARV